MRFNKLIVATVAVVSLSGCMTQQSLQGNAYSRDDARRVQTIQYATVETVTPVVIEGDRNNPVGMGSGAIIGGIAGSTIGGGKGSSIATVLGAVAGGIAGQALQEEVTRVQGQEMVIRMDSGEMLSVVQEVENNLFFRPGDRVRVLTSNGTMRISY